MSPLFVMASPRSRPTAGGTRRSGARAAPPCPSLVAFGALGELVLEQIAEGRGLRRRLLRAGGEVGNLATATDQPIPDVLDMAEQIVYNVSERRVGNGLSLIDPLLMPAIEAADE